MPSVSWASEGHATGSWDPPVQGNYLWILFPWFCDFSQGEHTSILEESWRNRKKKSSICPSTVFSTVALSLSSLPWQSGMRLFFKLARNLTERWDHFITQWWTTHVHMLLEYLRHLVHSLLPAISYLQTLSLLLTPTFCFLVTKENTMPLNKKWYLS